MIMKTQMERIIHNGYSNLAGINVWKHGEPVYEQYYNDCTASSTIHVASVTKSITSALFGIAIQDGFLQSINQKVLEFFPEYTNIKGNQTIQSIAIRDMLTMTAPYKCKVEPYQKFFTSDNWMEVALGILGGKGPIGPFLYAPIVGSHILGGILSKATGQSILEYTQKKLFSSLDIHVAGSMELTSKEKNMEFLKSKCTSAWVSDPQGINTASWGLTLTTNDMAKIGQLYLNHGKWNGEQIIPREWIAFSTTKKTDCGKLTKLSYGLLWWIIDEEEHAYAAMGDSGNVIYVNEKKDLVISIASLYMPEAKDRIKLIRDYIEPTFE